MDKTKVWFINGAGRGMGTTIAKAAALTADAEQKIANLQTEINAYRDLSKSMAYDN
ncbi:hypothetical protein MKY95_16375 [Paenibacillus sp. FSL P4-0176]|uniref:hypothetical protein n=1 Tax=Paenibacillus sp. FSL P4-0176 TaxID=2921631 RepID=UPI0030D4B850